MAKAAEVLSTSEEVREGRTWRVSTLAPTQAPKSRPRKSGWGSPARSGRSGRAATRTPLSLDGLRDKGFDVAQPE